MFTGLVQALGTVERVAPTADGVRLTIGAELARELAPGDSIAVNGVCLTAVEPAGERFEADVMRETLRRSAIAGLESGARVNLELPLRASDRLGGHIVQGHVDGTGAVRSVELDGFASVVTIAPETELLRYLVEKGSVAVDGVSLTVASLGEDAFAVSLIPETIERTSLGALEPGATVNLEVDVLAKYVERLMAGVAR